jgi:hypothetical protein
MESFKEFKNNINEKRIINAHFDIQNMLLTIFPEEHSDKKMLDELENAIKNIMEPIVKKYGYEIK